MRMVVSLEPYERTSCNIIETVLVGGAELRSVLSLGSASMRLQIMLPGLEVRPRLVS